METNGTIICVPRQFKLSPIPNEERSLNGVTRNLECFHVKQNTLETPVAVLSIVGGPNQYLPNEMIKNQLEYGLLEMMETTKIWIKTDGENTGVGKIVEEFVKNKENNLTHVFHEDSENIINFKDTNLNQYDTALEACITEHLKIPIIMIIIGGDECSFKTAMKYLEMDYPVLIHVHSINDTINSLDKAIQDTIFQIVCKGNKKDDRIIDNILHYVDLWNRPDIAEKEIFNIENINVVQTVQVNLGNEESKLSKLFKNALVGNRVDIVKQVFDYIQDKKQYKTFLENNIKTLYEETDCISRNLISKEGKNENIVKSINKVVIKILGSRKWKPFQENVDNKGSALYASSLARCLAKNANWKESIDQKTALLESSRQYEDLAYNVMTELYQIDRKEARNLLVTEVKRYNSTTILEITEKFSLTKFMGHAACQTKLNTIWKGRISTNTSNLKVKSI
ncbi:unnamed protein product [Mytilus coruscus]|uniref:Uncharacterized protein n=1 Tax=Mytilus coruscus TaxID=42192 RepID=A0A6J8EBB6_MYTCO|nr:unnamed protein product [Mytilus coruscus]